jgi:hypothetical protein
LKCYTNTSPRGTHFLSNAGAYDRARRIDSLASFEAAAEAQMPAAAELD